MLEKQKSEDFKTRKSVRFHEDTGPVDSLTVLSQRSPSRLGYTQDIPQIVETSFNSDSQDDSNHRDDQNHCNNDLPPLDLQQITAEADQESQPPDSGNKQLLERILDYDTREFGQQTDFPSTPSSPLIPGASERRENATHQYISSKHFLSCKGLTAKYPYEKTVFYVKNPPSQQFLGRVKCESSNVLNGTVVTPKADFAATYHPRVDSGYESRPETIRISPRKSPALSTTFIPSQTISRDNTSTMSTYGTDMFSPLSSARKQEKADLQRLNDRFSLYVQKVRQLNDQNNQLDTTSFIRQTKVLEDEVTTLKNLYERELDAIRLELDGVNRERSNLQIQCQKNKQAAIDFESRLAVESDKTRRLMDDLNAAQRKINTIETELLNAQAGRNPPGDFEALQRELDKLVRENEDHKRRQEQESLLRTEAEDRSHTLVKKMEFSDQIHAQQIAELRERLDQSQATIISLESRVRDLSKNDVAIPELLRQVRETSHQELHKYQTESEENYNRNISALKLQMDNDATAIEQLSAEKAQLVGETGELHAKIRNLEGQIHNLTHQKTSVESLMQQERARFTEQIQTMEKKLREMQELIFDKMREANSARDVNIPLKAEIDALKLLLEEEERRLQVPLPMSSQSQQQQQYQQHQQHQQQQYSSYSATSATQASGVTQNYLPISVTQAPMTTDSPFITQTAAHNNIFTEVPIGSQEAVPLLPTAPPMSPNIQSDHFAATLNADTSTNMLGAQKYTYETTPSVNRLQIEPSPPSTPRAVGPIARAKSAPAGARNAPLIPTTLGHGKDYFDEMFKDLTRETIYSHTRPKSSPDKRQKDEAEAAHRDRPRSSVYHDYTTSTSSAVGDIKILEVNQDGKYVRLVNEGKQEVEFGGYMIQQNVGGHPVAVFRFPPRTKFPDNSTITVWAGSNDALIHDPPKDFVWKEQQKWGTGPECTSILCKPNGQAIAWTTAAHRFTRNAFEETTSRPSTAADQKEGETEMVQTSHEEPLTEMNVNLNEPKPEPVFLRREKQTPPSLAAQKHPHGTSPGQDTHPHTGQPRPFTYGNDNSSVNRQSRSQSTRPDPVQGQPYAGSSGNRLGSAPLKKFNKSAASNGNIRGSGALANRSNPGVTSPPPSPFQTPHSRFEAGLQQLKSQHHQDYLPPMPRPPLFSAW